MLTGIRRADPFGMRKRLVQSEVSQRAGFQSATGVQQDGWPQFAVWQPFQLAVSNHFDFVHIAGCHNVVARAFG